MPSNNIEEIVTTINNTQNTDKILLEAASEHINQQDDFIRLLRQERNTLHIELEKEQKKSENIDLYISYNTKQHKVIEEKTTELEKLNRRYEESRLILDDNKELKQQVEEMEGTIESLLSANLVYIEENERLISENKRIGELEKANRRYEDLQNANFNLIAENKIWREKDKFVNLLLNQDLVEFIKKISSPIPSHKSFCLTVQCEIDLAEIIAKYNKFDTLPENQINNVLPKLLPYSVLESENQQFIARIDSLKIELVDTQNALSKACQDIIDISHQQQNSLKEKELIDQKDQLELQLQSAFKSSEYHASKLKLANLLITKHNIIYNYENGLYSEEERKLIQKYISFEFAK